MLFRSQTNLIFFKGHDWSLIDVSIEVFINDKFQLKASFKKGFSFELVNSEIPRQIKIKMPLGFEKKIEIPRLNNNKSYEIEIEYNRFWGMFNSKPKIVEK